MKWHTYDFRLGETEHIYLGFYQKITHLILNTLCPFYACKSGIVPVADEPSRPWILELEFYSAKKYSE